MLLPENYTEDIDPTGYWISEKYDGVRAYWNGTKLLSTWNNAFASPWTLPAVPLDGELWLGHGRFDEARGVTSRNADPWEGVKYMVFDAPEVAGDFETRQGFLLRMQARAPIEIVQQWRCRGRQHLQEELGRVVEAGGEGLMLRRSGSLYVHGRSSSLLKVKQLHDTEAEVIGYLDGKHEGRIGALLCKREGVVFSIGTGFSEKQRREPPAIGAMITFRYRGFTGKGKPRFPSFLRVRS